MEKIINCLKNNKEVSAWRIVESKKTSCELFYVLKKLETNRATSTIDIALSVYVDVDGKRGSSTVTIYPYMDEEEITKVIEKGVYSAKLALNKYYDLPEGTGETVSSPKSNLSNQPFTKVIDSLVNAVFKEDKYENGWINATEFFLYKTDIRIVNSKGVDYSYTSYEGNIELIPTWKKDNGEEFEVYKMIKFQNLNLDEISSEVKDALMEAKDRSIATPLAAGFKGYVIFENEEAKQILEMITRDLNYQAEYQHMAMSNLNESVQGDNIVGDKLDITLSPYVEGSFTSKPVDEDGIVLKDIKIVENGIAIAKHGSNTYGYYLGVKNPTGSIPNMVVKCGTTSIEDIKKEDYIECNKMSAMQAEFFSGFIGGECRLGYYNGKPVTSFSATGNFHELKKNMILSKEEVILPGYKGPKYIIFKDIQIS